MHLKKLNASDLYIGTHAVSGSRLSLTRARGVKFLFLYFFVQISTLCYTDLMANISKASW